MGLKSSVMDGIPQVVAALEQRLAQKGSLGVDDVMEVALYLPGAGLYRRSCPAQGAEGHFTTCARLAPALGRAIARWLVLGWQKGLGSPLRWHVIEVGGGDGSLARAVLDALPRPLRWTLSYHMVEISEPARELQRQRLGREVRWAESVDAALRRCRGQALLFSNELVDAFPAVVLERRGDRWREVRLVERDRRLVEELGPEPDWLEGGDGHSYSVAALARPPESSRVEIHRSFERWLSRWAPALRRGWVLTIDYGGECDELYGRGGGGTMRAYFANFKLDERADLYRRLGQQDLTCDVNFTDLSRWGRRHGLETVELFDQRELLRRFGQLRAAEPTGAVEFLSRPAGAGAAFRVLWQKKR